VVVVVEDLVLMVESPDNPASSYYRHTDLPRCYDRP
jgi:hypothetical protein